MNNPALVPELIHNATFNCDVSLMNSCVNNDNLK